MIPNMPRDENDVPYDFKNEEIVMELNDAPNNSGKLFSINFNRKIKLISNISEFFFQIDRVNYIKIP